MNDNQNVLIEIIRSTYAVAWQDPYNTKKYANYITYFALFLWIIILIFTILEAVFNYVDIVTIAIAFEIIAPCIQIMSKTTLYLRYKKRIQHLLHQIDNTFWNIDTHGFQKQKNFINITAKLLKTHRFCSFFLCMIIVIATVFSKDRKFFFNFYDIMDINNNYYYITKLILYAISIYSAAPLVIGFDILSISFIVLISIQLEMLRHAYLTLGNNDTESNEQEKDLMKKLAEYIKHHNMLLEFMEEVKQMLSIFFLVQYMSSLLAFCMITYVVNDENVNRKNSENALSMLCVMDYLLQLFVYCLFADNASSTVRYEFVPLSLNNLSDAAYFSGWSNHSKQFATSIQFVIMRSQKHFKFTAAGIFNIDMNSFLQIIKTSFSFLTFLRTMNADKST